MDFILITGMNVPTCKKTKTHHSLLTRQASSSKSRGNQCSSIMKLPEKVIAHILSYLPVKSLLLFKCVSRLWCSLIESEYFIKLHLRNFVHDSSGAKLSLILQDTCFSTPKIFSVTDVGSQSECVELGGPFGYRTRILGSCNGLLCVCQSDMEDSVEYKEYQEKLDIKRSRLWFNWSIAAAVIVFLGLLIMIVVSMQPK